MFRSRRLFAALAVVALTACGSSSTTAPTIETTTFAASLGIDLTQMTKSPSGLYSRDLTVGTGATAAVGDSVSVHYTGWLANGTQFDANVAGQAPFKFRLGVGQVIEGWDEGVVGMKVGGERQLVIPPALGYGENRVGTIPANSILVFKVQLVSKP